MKKVIKKLASLFNDCCKALFVRATKISMEVRII